MDHSLVLDVTLVGVKTYVAMWIPRDLTVADLVAAVTAHRRVATAAWVEGRADLALAVPLRQLGLAAHDALFVDTGAPPLLAQMAALRIDSAHDALFVDTGAPPLLAQMAALRIDS